MSENVMAFDELKRYICEALSDMPGVYADSNGVYYSEIYKDYRDDISDKEIARVLRADDPMQALYEMLDEAYGESEIYLEDEVVNGLKENEDIVRIIATYESVDEDSLRDCLRDVWYARVPVDAFLKQEVCMDVILDTGDGNYELTHNILTEAESVEEFEDDSSLLWLCEQQGVTREELFAAFEKGDAHSDEVCALFDKKRELTDALKKYGFKESAFGRSVIHTGAYNEYTRLKDELSKKELRLHKLNADYEKCDISYEEYMKKHFDRFARLDPMSKEQFDAKKTEVLEKTAEQISVVKNEIGEIKNRFANNVDYGAVAKLQHDIRDVDVQLSIFKMKDAWGKAEFINSVMRECYDTYGMAAVTFLVKMTLEEAIRLQEVINSEKEVNNSYDYDKRSGKSSFVLDKGVRCGLMDAWQGKGSVFEIELLKDVEIPVKALEWVRPDRANGEYGFMEIYGANDEYFTSSLKEIHEVPLTKVNDLIADAASRVDVEQSSGEAVDFEIDK